MSIADNHNFVRWLSNLVRRDDWNGIMRTPTTWKEMYDAGLTCEQAAKAPRKWKTAQPIAMKHSKQRN